MLSFSRVSECLHSCSSCVSDSRLIFKFVVPFAQGGRGVSSCWLWAGEARQTLSWCSQWKVEACPRILRDPEPQAAGERLGSAEPREVAKGLYVNIRIDVVYKHLIGPERDFFFFWSSILILCLQNGNIPFRDPQCQRRYILIPFNSLGLLFFFK